MAELNKAARNERRKITGTYLNALASGLIVVGVFAPSIAIAYGGASIEFLPWNLVGTAAICTFLSLSLHWLARQTLKRVEE